MAELDYAFLADFSQIQDGKLTVVGGSYTHVKRPIFPADHLLCVAGRVRVPEPGDGVGISITVAAPEESYRLGVAGQLLAEPNTPRYDGKIGLLFSVSTMIPVPIAGLYEVFIALVLQSHLR